MRPRPPLRISHTGDVPMAPDDAYALLADARRRPQWLSELSDTNNAPSALRDGDIFRAHTHFLGHELAGVSEVTGVEPARGLLQERVVVGVSFTSTWVVTREGDGCRVEHTIEIELPAGALGAIERRLFAWRLRAMQRRSLRALARL